MKRKTDEEIKAELRAIYAGQDGEMPDLTKLDRRGGSRLTRWLVGSILILLLLSGAAWVGFFVWSRGGIAPGQPLETAVDAPETARSGEEAFYVFRYENGGNAPLAALQMKLTLPPEFEVTSANPAPTDGLTWTLGSLSRGSDGSITVGGVFRAEVPSTHTLQALYTYKPANFSSDFQDIATVKVDVSDSILKTTISGPEKALPGDDATYVVNVQNGGTRDAQNVLVSGVFPEGFAITASDPAPAEPGAASWRFDRLAPGELKAVTMTGRFTASVTGTQTVGAQAAFVGADNAEFPQTRSETFTDVLGGAMAFHLVVNGSSSDQAADPGDVLRASIDYANQGNETVKGLGFTLTLAGEGTPPIDWARASLGGGTRAGNVITWDADAVDAFADFAPGTSGVIDLSLPVASSLSASSASAFTLGLVATLDQIGSLVAPRRIEASPLAVAVNSDFRSSAHARYYSEDAAALGSGPLPPTVGETTTYRVVWRVANSFHALSNLRMTANLPPNVGWTGNVQADIGTIAFDQTTRIVTWSVPALPTSVPGAEATFDLAITPTDADVGAFYKLTNAIAVEATDTVTKAQVANGIDILTTEIPEDETAAGKGVVVK